MSPSDLDASAAEHALRLLKELLAPLGFRMIRQRLRGILRTTIATTIPWAAVGLFAGLAFQFGLVPGVVVFLNSRIPGGLVAACTLVGATVGAVNGLTLSGLILATERGKNLEDLRAWRFAAWGALATAATLGLFFQSPVVAALGAVLGAGAGSAALSAARRARAPEETGLARPLSD